MMVPYDCLTLRRAFAMFFSRQVAAATSSLQSATSMERHQVESIVSDTERPDRQTSHQASRGPQSIAQLK